MIQITKLQAIFGNKNFWLNVAQTKLGLIYTLAIQDCQPVRFWTEKELDVFIEELWQRKFHPESVNTFVRELSPDNIINDPGFEL